MQIKQFQYEPLAHYSYALLSKGEMAIIDPERDPMQYYTFAKENNARIIAVIETHPHADFISSHLQIHRETGAVIYNSKKLGADYPHKTFDQGDSIRVGNATLRALNTPGHSPDSITVIAEEDSKTVLFTGDTLFIGDVGRPDLREKSGNMKAKRRELAEAMFSTIQNEFSGLPDDALVYPAHGAGSLCGKDISSDNSSTLGKERMGNWAFKDQTKEEFINTLLDSQPFIPGYFGYNVDINKAGAASVRQAIAGIPFRINTLIQNGIIADTRKESTFKKGHLKGSINIQVGSEDAKFETWLGSVLKPTEDFHLVIEDPEELETILRRVARIGYEKQLKSVVTLPFEGLVASPELDLKDFKAHPDKYTIVDVRQTGELAEGKIFDNAINHPLNSLRENSGEIPTDKPVVVHCAGGYRSAVGSSILENRLDGVTVFDLSEEVKQFQG